MTRTGEGAHRIADEMDEAGVPTLGEWARKRWEGATPEEREEACRQSERRRSEMEEEIKFCEGCGEGFHDIIPEESRGAAYDCEHCGFCVDVCCRCREVI